LDDLRLTLEKARESLYADLPRPTPLIRHCQLLMDIHDILHFQGSHLYSEIFEINVASFAVPWSNALLTLQVASAALCFI